MLFPRLDFPNNVCLSTESVAVHTHRSHTFSGTVHYGEEAWSESDCLWPSCALDLQQESWSLDYHVPLWALFDNFPWVCITEYHQCEVILMLPRTMKYISDENMLLYCVNKDKNTNTYDFHSIKGHTTLRICGFTRRMWVPITFHNKDCSNVGVNLTVVTLGSLTLCLPYNDGQDLDPWTC